MSHINAPAVAKQELKVTQTWPRNTERLPGLVQSVMVPLMAGVVRLVAAPPSDGGL